MRCRDIYGRHSLPSDPFHFTTLPNDNFHLKPLSSNRSSQRFSSVCLCQIWPSVACFPLIASTILLGLALLTLSWDKNWDSHSLVNGYPSFYPRIALVAPSPGVNYRCICGWDICYCASSKLISHISKNMIIYSFLKTIHTPIRCSSCYGPPLVKRYLFSQRCYTSVGLMWICPLGHWLVIIGIPMRQHWPDVTTPVLAQRWANIAQTDKFTLAQRWCGDVGPTWDQCLNASWIGVNMLFVVRPGFIITTT